MWAVISEGKIIQTINNPRPLTLSGIQYPRSIFHLLGQMQREKL